MAVSVHPQPATVAAARASRAGLALGAAGVAWAVFVLVRLAESWRVSPNSAGGHLTLLGIGVSYPVANADAVVILVLALCGGAVLVRIATGIGRELAAQRRLARKLRERVVAPAIAGARGAIVIDDPHPGAFSAGLLRPHIYLTTAAIEQLGAAELETVLAHERHHALRRDPLRLATGRVLVGALGPVPGMQALIERAGDLAELSADEFAVAGSPDRRAALAGAMLHFDDGARSGRSAGIDPARVDHLLGVAGDWQFPALLCLAAAATLALLTTIALLAGRVAAGSATLAPPFLSSRPCVIVLATIPVLLATTLGTLTARRLRAIQAGTQQWADPVPSEWRQQF